MENIQYKMELSCYYQGRLGNQLFQLAHLVGMSRKWNMSAIITPPICGEYFTNIEYSTKSINLRIPVYERGFAYQEITKGTGNYFIGYWQSEKYFLHCADEIRHMLDFKPKITLQGDWCALHIRRGDYLKLAEYHTNIGIEYYQKALELIPQGIPLIIFSDDIEYVKSLTFEGRIVKYETDFLKEEIRPCNVDFLKEEIRPIDGLGIMKQCKYIIGANSSYSWWGAWLSSAEIKIFPKKWFGPRCPHDTKDLIPESWIILDW